MGMSTGGGGGYNSEINVTPLVDVVLVLLIIFMVIVPLTQRGYELSIPRETQNVVPQQQQEKQVILAINEAGCAATQPLGPAGLPPDCVVSVNKENVRISELAQRVAEVFQNRKKVEDRMLFLAAEESINYEAVIRIVDIAKSKAGDDLRIGIVTDEKLATGAGAGS
jgi:biopolymer transport protein TolR